jgi:hypothetical protein
VPAPGDRALPKPPLGDLGDHLVRPEVVNRHAHRLLKDRVLTGVRLDDLRDLLARTWLLYVQYRALSERLKTQHRDVLLRARGPRLPRHRLYKELIQRRQDSRKQAKATLKHLARPARNRPEKYADQVFIETMRMLWEEHSTEPHRVGWTASGWGKGDDSKQGTDGRRRASREGPFERFANDWLLTIDPGRRIPSRHLYAATKRRMQKQPTYMNNGR